MKVPLILSVMFSMCPLVALNGVEARIAISDLLADYLSEPINEFAKEHGHVLTIFDIGSLPAMDRLRADELELAIIAMPETSERPDESFQTYPFAYDISVVVTNENNPLNEISIGGLGGIFGTNEELNFNTWGELGLSGWGNRNIKPMAGVDETSIAFELFRHKVLLRGDLKTSVSMFEDREIEGIVRADAASIAVMSRVPTSRNVKVLMISTGRGAPAYGPTVENVHFGDYPIRLGFHVVFKKRDAERVKPFLRALLSDEVAETLTKHGFFPLPETVRRQFLFDLELGN